jgi:hypothetical protein
MELHQALSELGEEKRLDLVAVSWIGRGDFAPFDFGTARDLANRRHRHRSAVYLLSAPRLADDLECGLRLALSIVPGCESDVRRQLRLAGAMDSQIVIEEGLTRRWAPPSPAVATDRPKDETRHAIGDIRSARAV